MWADTWITMREVKTASEIMVKSVQRKMGQGTVAIMKILVI
jgi:hypothetical protein